MTVHKKKSARMPRRAPRDPGGTIGAAIPRHSIPGLGDYSRAPSSIVVKLRSEYVESQHIPYSLEGASRVFHEFGPVLTGLESSKRPKPFRPLYTSVWPRMIERVLAEAKKRSPSYSPPNMLTYYKLAVPPSVELESVSHQLMSPELESIVETAYPTPRIHLPSRTNDQYVDEEVFLRPADRGGIDAFYAWDRTGGKGEGQRLIDLEGGWTAHEDLPTDRMFLQYGLSSPGDDEEHGTNVLGVVCAVENTLGVVGVAPLVSEVDLVSWWRDDGTYSTGDALWVIAVETALWGFAMGDVLLLEVEQDVFGFKGEVKGMPLESDQASFDLIELLTALGLVVVEAAGNGGINGGHNLDDFQDPTGAYVFQRGVRDSKAILVGGGANVRKDVYTKTGRNFNEGARVDCFAQAGDVWTTSNTPPRYATAFGATSAASAIIAGAALVVQGIAAARGKGPILSESMRGYLASPRNATAATEKNKIGVMPDLSWVVEEVLR